MSAYQDWRTLRDIDQALGAAKGTSFRAFKRLEARLVEGRDYCLLDPVTEAQLIATLRAGERLYASSLRVLLLSSKTAARLLESAHGTGESGP